MTILTRQNSTAAGVVGGLYRGGTVSTNFPNCGGHAPHYRRICGGNISK